MLGHNVRMACQSWVAFSRLPPGVLLIAKRFPVGQSRDPGGTGPQVPPAMTASSHAPAPCRGEIGPAQCLVSLNSAGGSPDTGTTKCGTQSVRLRR